jgi:hypothetical protein
MREKPPYSRKSLVSNDLRQLFLFNCFFLSVWLVVGGGIGWRTMFLSSRELVGSFGFFFFMLVFQLRPLRRLSPNLRG